MRYVTKIGRGTIEIVNVNIDLFGKEIPPGQLIEEWKRRQRKVNPLLHVFGKGPEGARCKHCRHLFANCCSKTYYKCDLRPFTRGPGTDHKANWPACGKFEKAI